MTISHNERNRMMQERCQHSDETISRHFHRVLMAIVKFSMSIIVLSSLDSVSEHIRTNPKYWPFKVSIVVDAGYANTTGFLAPYRKTRYHLPDYQSGSCPRGHKELFNHAYSSLRNVIERCFGCLKSKWLILSKMPSFSLETQKYIVVACMALHNFIRKECLADKDFKQYGNDEYFEEGPRVPDDPLEYTGSSHGQREIELILDAIADAILVARVYNATT